jgi:hypothetical protein
MSNDVVRESSAGRVSGAAQPDDEYRTPRPADYRANAADCLRMMQLATNEEVRAALLLMAQSWNQLANRLEVIAVGTTRPASEAAERDGPEA